MFTVPTSSGRRKVLVFLCALVSVWLGQFNFAVAAMATHLDTVAAASLAARFRVFVVAGLRPKFSAKLAETLLSKSQGGLGVSAALGMQLVSVLMRGSVIEVGPATNGSMIVQYYNPYCDVVVLVRFETSKPLGQLVPTELIAANGTTEAVIANAARFTGSAAPPDLLARVRLRTTEFGKLFAGGAKMFGFVGQAFAARDDAERRVASLQVLINGIASLTDVERAGLDDFSAIVQKAEFEQLKYSHKIIYVPAISALATLAPLLRQHLLVVAANGLAARRIVYMAPLGWPNAVIRLDTSTQPTRLTIKRISFLNLMNGLETP